MHDASVDVSVVVCGLSRLERERFEERGEQAAGTRCVVIEKRGIGGTSEFDRVDYPRSRVRSFGTRIRHGRHTLRLNDMRDRRVVLQIARR